jgi:acyl transferase domain-containing protein/acyl carrier protein
LRDAPLIPVAVIGMACRLPGGIDSPEKFWLSLLRGDDVISEIPPERWDADDYYDPEQGVPDRSVSRWGGFLDDVMGFDAPFFGFGEREAAAIDPQHRLLLETSWEAVEHAGLDPASLAGSLTGVFVGLCHDDYLLVTRDAGALSDAYSFTGTPFSMASGRIAYRLGLRGPAMTVDTGCSTGLLTVHLACRSLDHGESDLAIAGGASVMLSPLVTSSASAQGMLSPRGRCRTFDVGADGFVRSEGCAVVLLKRLPDALRDGDRILAVVRGTAANQDGRTPNIATPAIDAQIEVFRAALAEAGVDAGTVGVVEAHGTGTPVGDPIEFSSLSQVYGAGKACALGSAKSNLGHTESAAGAVGLIKAVLALQHGVVPPMVHFTGLPDDLRRIDTGLFVPKAVTPWPTRTGETPRRAAVSSYGMSGTNVHAVLEQAPQTTTADNTSPALADPLLFAVSATSAEELHNTSRRLAEWVGDHADDVTPSDLAYTLARRRAHRPVRTAVIASTLADLGQKLRDVAEGDTPYLPAVGQDDRGPVWVFSGQGSQWAAMGAGLLATEPAFAACIGTVEPLIAREAGFSVTEAMSAPETVTGIDRVQPVLFAMQVALATAMRSYGVHPSAVIGHSLGEVSAAVVAGALTLEDGVRIICRRSRLLRLVAGGAMAAIELPAQRVREELAARGVDDVVVSVIASPQSIVVGGETEAVRDMVAAWELRGVMAREIAVDVASHSPHVDPILAELADVLTELTPTTPTVRYYSATLDDPRARPSWDADYWVDNLRHPVRFASAVQAALDDGHRVFAELSPHPLLTRAVEQNADATDIVVQALPSLRRGQEVPHGLLEFLADLHSVGAAVDFSVLYPNGELVDAPLPTWTHRQLLVGSDGQRQQAHDGYTVAVHPLLGAHVRLPEEPERHAWQGEVGLVALPWLADHQVHAVPAFPGAAYCEMALAAARTVLGEASEVCDIRFEQMLLLNDQTPVAAVASVDAPGVVDFAVETQNDGEQTRGAVAVLRAAEDEPQPPKQSVSTLLGAHPFRTDGAEIRQWWERRGVQLGPAFAGLIATHTAENATTVVAEVGLPGSLRSQHGDYGVHPALLDACFQSIVAHPSVKDVGGGLLLPLSVRRLHIFGPLRNARYCLVRVTAHDRSGVEANLDVLDDSGTVVLIARGFRMGNRASEGSERERVLAERLLTVNWLQNTPTVPDVTVPGDWLLITTSDTEDSLATGLADALKGHGAQPDLLHWPQRADHRASAEQLTGRLRAGGITGLVVLLPPPTGNSDEESLARGRDHVRHLVRIASELPELPGEPPRLYVMTRAAQAVLPGDQVNLEQAGLRGLMRVIGAEHPQLRPTHIDVDENTDAEQVATELLSGSEEDETACRGGQWLTARLSATPLRPHERRTTTAKYESDGMRLQIRTPGDLETMELAAFDRVPPGPGQIEVAVAASSVNFADALIAFGRYPSFDGQQPQLGIDFAGVVTAVGPDVTEHQVGDLVGGISASGCWGTFLTCDARLAVALPPGMTADQAAAASTAYCTAWHGLENLASIAPGDRVLIHSATGGVGQAAMAVARRAGAEIFATAGSPQRRELLRDMGIEHVYDSRSTEFADLIRRDTDGYGVDIVLNSLTGAAQRAGLELLSSGGRFVEIGKRDVYGNTRLGLYPFRRNLTFSGVDLALLCGTHPQRIGDLLRTVYRLIAGGELPVPEHTCYPLADAATAIRVLSAAEHIGKLVLSVPRTGHSSVVVPPQRARVFRRDGAYIVTGGLGGLGLFLAGGMAAAGCGRIVLTGRSQPSAKAEQAIARIRATGAEIEVVCGNIAEPGTASKLVAAAAATGLPVRGVLHAAAVVKDATLTNITDELVETDWAPKVYGAWHLHHATATQPLDWFCSFSSAAALLGSPGQGAYAAANSWLDGFTHWRRTQGLPATAIAWGAWAEIGRAVALEEGGQTTMITPREGAYAFQALLRHDRGFSGYVPIIGSPWLTGLAQRTPFAEAFQATGQNRADSSAFRVELSTLSQEEWPTRFRHLIVEQVSLILRRTIDTDRPFVDHGLDSLGNLELRTHIETETGMRLTPAAIATHNTVRALAQHLSDALAAEQTA